MALAERPTLTPEERADILARLAIDLGDDDDSDWYNLGHEEPDPDPLPVNTAGMAALVRFFALLEEERPKWQRDALCIEYADLGWFPGRGDDLTELRDVCSRCLVAAECLAYALSDASIEAGCWGGVVGRGLRRLRAEAA